MDAGVRVLRICVVDGAAAGGVSMGVYGLVGGCWMWRVEYINETWIPKMCHKKGGEKEV